MKTVLAFVIAALASIPLAQSGAPCAAGHVFDDGGAESFVIGGYLGPCGSGLAQYRIAVSRFTPPYYPYHFDELCAFLAGPGAISFEAVVFDDDGPSGGPATLLASVPANASVSLSGTWVQVLLDCHVVLSGSRWIGVRVPEPCGVPNTVFGVDAAGLNPFALAGDDGQGSRLWTHLYSAGPALMVRVQGGVGVVTAQATVRLGSGVNPLAYTAEAPVIGSDWTAIVTHAPGATFTAIQFRGAASQGTILAGGEVLLDLASPRLFASVRASSGVQDVHVLTVPADSSLIGVTLATQAGVLMPTSYYFCNAVDLRIGC